MFTLYSGIKIRIFHYIMIDKLQMISLTKTTWIPVSICNNKIVNKLKKTLEASNDNIYISYTDRTLNIKTGINKINTENYTKEIIKKHHQIYEDHINNINKINNKIIRLHNKKDLMWDMIFHNLANSWENTQVPQSWNILIFTIIQTDEKDSGIWTKIDTKRQDKIIEINAIEQNKYTNIGKEAIV